MAKLPRHASVEAHRHVCKNVHPGQTLLRRLNGVPLQFHCSLKRQSQMRGCPIPAERDVITNVAAEEKLPERSIHLVRPIERRPATGHPSTRWPSLRPGGKPWNSMRIAKNSSVHSTI